MCRLGNKSRALFPFWKRGEKDSELSKRWYTISFVSKVVSTYHKRLPMLNISERRIFISAFHVCVMMITLDLCVRLCIYVPRHHVITELHVYRVGTTHYLYAAVQKSILGRDVMCSTHVIR